MWGAPASPGRASVGERAPLVDGEEGTRAVELANAVYLSSLEDRIVELPLERGEYTPWYEELVAGSLTI